MKEAFLLRLASAIRPAPATGKALLAALAFAILPAQAQDTFARVSGTIGDREIENLAGLMEDSGHEEWDGAGGIVSICTMEVDPPSGLGQMCFSIAGPDLRNGPHEQLSAAILPTDEDMSTTYINAPEVPGTQMTLPQASLDRVEMEGGILHVAGRFEAVLTRINTTGGVIERDGAIPISLSFEARLPKAEDME